MTINSSASIEHCEIKFNDYRHNTAIFLVNTFQMTSKQNNILNNLSCPIFFSVDRIIANPLFLQSWINMTSNWIEFDKLATKLNEMRLILCPIILFCCLSITLQSQTEEILSAELEGTRVEVLIDMPATSQGIDIMPDRPQQLDFNVYSDRIKEHGVSISAGDVVMVTKIKVKNKHIEFQLAGGGYGTFWDEDEFVASQTIEKSTREKELENILKNKNDEDIPNRKELQDELDDLRQERRREQQESDRETALQEELKRDRIATKKLQSGSRFNIRYRNRLESNDLTLEAIQNALSKYVRFIPIGLNDSAESSTETMLAAKLRKGLSIEEAFGMYGAPISLSTSSACNLKITSCVFSDKDQEIQATFVEDVLVKYSIQSK